MKTSQLILLFIILCTILYLFFSIVPCKPKKVVKESFNTIEIPDNIKQMLNGRLEILKDQVVKNNNLGKSIQKCLNDIATCKDKIKKMMAESDNTNQVYSTNGDIIEVDDF